MPFGSTSTYDTGSSTWRRGSNFPDGKIEAHADVVELHDEGGQGLPRSVMVLVRLWCLDIWRAKA